MPICKRCKKPGWHYVPSVCHLAGPDDAITPYYTCDPDGPPWKPSDNE
jgi:hypothetical protein